MHLRRLATKTFRADADIFAAGEIPDSIAILQSGWAYKFVPLEHGQRQILSFYMAGDIIDQDAVALPNTPLLFPTRALTDTELCFFDAGDYRALLSQDARSRRFVKQHLLHNKELIAKHLVDVARRRAPNRIASFIYELQQRLQERGLDGDTIPFRQQDIADALGMTIAHVNRTLKGMRDICTVDIGAHVLHITNARALVDLATQAPGALDHNDNHAA